MDQDVAAPAVLHGLPGVPGARLRGIELVEQGDVAEPGQLCKHPLHEFPVRPGLGEGPHILEVPGREAGGLRELGPQVHGQPVDDLGAPALGRLPGQDVLADGPVEQHQFAVDGHRGAQPGSADALLDVREQGRVGRFQGWAGHGAFVSSYSGQALHTLTSLDGQHSGAGQLSATLELNY